MIITRAPFRISFFGGGTDYPAYYRDHCGAVLATTINRYCYISLRRLPPFFEHKHRIVWSKAELAKSIDEINHPSVRECLRYMDVEGGFEIHHDGDLPARSGLGSSSSFTVGLLHALYAFKGKMVSKMKLAESAIYVEQEMIKENVGSQDQTMASFGGFNIVEFNGGSGQHIQVRPLCLNPERLMEIQSHLMIFFTGIVRTASDIAKEQIELTSQNTCELGEMCNMVNVAVDILSNNNDIHEFGRLLHENWLIKKSLTNKISNSFIDEIYETARKTGAIGGKILGAGGGGFLLLFVKPEDQPRVKEAMGLLHVPFRFEYNGSQIILYEPYNSD